MYTVRIRPPSMPLSNFRNMQLAAEREKSLCWITWIGDRAKPWGCQSTWTHIACVLNFFLVRTVIRFIIASIPAYTLFTETADSRENSSDHIRSNGIWFTISMH